jgi:hypothetical protein
LLSEAFHFHERSLILGLCSYHDGRRKEKRIGGWPTASGKEGQTERYEDDD